MFYDRQGLDWDATITKVIVDKPYQSATGILVALQKGHPHGRGTGRCCEGPPSQTRRWSSHVARAGGSPAAPGRACRRLKPVDIGTVAALGVAVGAVGGALATVATGLARLAPWQLPLVVVAVILVISLPAVLIAALKLRQRTIGPLLEANGWAINGRVRINIPFGTALTEHAELPAGSRRSLVDPYADKAAANRRRGFFLLIVILLAALVTANVLHTWPFTAAAPAAAPRLWLRRNKL